MYGAGLADMQQQMRPPPAARAAAEQRAAAAAAGDGAAGVLAAATMRCAGCASKVPRPCAQLLYRRLVLRDPSSQSETFEYAHGTAACRIPLSRVSAQNPGSNLSGKQLEDICCTHQARFAAIQCPRHVLLHNRWAPAPWAACCTACGTILSPAQTCSPAWTRQTTRRSSRRRRRATSASKRRVRLSDQPETFLQIKGDTVHSCPRRPSNIVSILVSVTYSFQSEPLSNKQNCRTDNS